MKARILALLATAAIASSVMAAPLVPRIFSYDVNFAAWEPIAGGVAAPSYFTNGALPDTLSFGVSNPLNHEATGLWPVWPGDPLPLFGFDGVFGAEVEMNVRFDGHDEMPPHLDVSLTGPGGVFRVTGSIAGGPPGMILEITADQSVMYGYSGQDAYVVELAGTITGVDPQFDFLLGAPGVVRGHMDFLDNPMFPSGYDPLDPNSPDASWPTIYSGEAGEGVPTPEPTTLTLLALGGLALARRRR
jgi:hypothetical protein